MAFGCRRLRPDGTITLAVNETWNYTTAADLAAAFTQALG